ncbi:hypothetical protein C8J56DRAFT_719024, partial [Mycena floridula]
TLREGGKTSTEIGNKLGINRSSAYRNYHKHAQNHDFYPKILNRGRPQALDNSERLFARRKIWSGECGTTADVQRTYFPHVAESTMHKTLTEEGLPGCRKQKVTYLRSVH